MTLISTNKPATAPAETPLRHLVAWLRGLIGAYRTRRSLQTDLGKLSDRTLRDAGLTRHDVTGLGHLPRGADGRRHLQSARGCNIGRW